MPTSKRAITVYIESKIEQFIEDYCQKTNTLGRDKEGNIVPRWSTAISNLLTTLSQLPSDKFHSLLNQSTVQQSTFQDKKITELEERISRLESIIQNSVQQSVVYQEVYQPTTMTHERDLAIVDNENVSKFLPDDTEKGITQCRSENKIALAEYEVNEDDQNINEYEVKEIEDKPQNNSVSEPFNDKALEISSQEDKVDKSTITPKKKNKPVKSDSETGKTELSEVLDITEKPFIIDETTEIVKESNGECFTIKSNLKVKENSKEYEVTGIVRDEQLTENEDQKVDEENPPDMIETATTERLEVKSEETNPEENEQTELLKAESTVTSKDNFKPLKNDSERAKIEPFTLFSQEAEPLTKKQLADECNCSTKHIDNIISKEREEQGIEDKEAPIVIIAPNGKKYRYQRSSSNKKRKNFVLIS